MLHWIRRLKRVVRSLFKGEFKRDTFSSVIMPHRRYLAKCGHETKLEGVISKFGKETEITLCFDDEGVIDTCLQCVSDATIACAWCGEHILPDEGITLYASVDPKYSPHEGSVVYKKDDVSGKVYYVGCLRWNCADSGADRTGFWILPGKVQRCLSPLEECLRGEKVVIIDDLSDPDQATLIEDE